MSAVELKGVGRRYGELVALAGVDLTVAPGEFVALLGASGSGKTTLLRLVAGLDRPGSGSLAAEGRVGMVFQDLGLWPHLTAHEQLRLVLRSRPSGQTPAALLERMGIADRGGAHPFELSGGEAQRLALARTLAIEPELLLLDEPLSGLDRPLRDELFAEILALHRALGATTLYVTHDRTEALAADRVVVLESGRLIQQGPPDTVYRQPATEGVARLTGLVGFWREDDGVLVLRPEDVQLDAQGPLEGVVEIARFEAGVWRLALRIEQALLWCNSGARRQVGQSLRVRLSTAAWRLP